MNEYIAHQRYDGFNMNGEQVLIRYKDRLERKGDILYYKNKPICIWRSLIGKQYFSRNNDDLGLQRGELTYKIAYAKRGDGSQRFTDKEQKLLREKYSHFLKPLNDVILFNDDFFELNLEELQQIDNDLKNYMIEKIS